MQLPLRRLVESPALALAVLSASGIAMIGCWGGHDVPQVSPELAQVIQPIIRGTPSGAIHDAVVVLTTFEAGARTSLCTATVVAPNLLITARHCVSDAGGSTACAKDGTPVTGGEIKADRDPKSLVVFVGNGGVTPDTANEANASARGAKLIVDQSPTLCNRDVAFVVLDTMLTTPIAPIRIGPPGLDEKVAVVGWGIDETGELPASREVRSNVGLIGIGPAMYPDNLTFGYGDHEFMLGESACAGDSGSPALMPSGAVAGVAARAGNGLPRDPSNYASTCMGDTAHAVYTHLSTMQDLVARAFTTANQPMWLEGQPDPRAPKASAAEDKPAPPTTTTASELPSEATESVAEGTPSASAGGCTMVPQQDAVEHAAGFAAMLALVGGLRRRARQFRGKESSLGRHDL